MAQVSYVGTFQQENLGFQGHALAFLEALKLSRAGLPLTLLRSIRSRPVEDGNGFAERIQQAAERTNGCYNGFNLLRQEGNVTKIYWTCMPPHRALSDNDAAPTQLVLERSNGFWRVSIEGRDETTVQARLRAAEGKPAPSVPRRIVNAL